MKFPPLWFTCPSPKGEYLAPNFLQRACIFNQIRMAVVGLSFGIWLLALFLDTTPLMVYPIGYLLLWALLTTLVGFPLYLYGLQKAPSSLVIRLWGHLQVLNDLAIILLTIHYTGGLESPGNLLLLTYLAGAAFIFSWKVVLSFAFSATLGYALLGWGYAHHWWQAYYSDGTLQPAPSLQRALLLIATDLIFTWFIAGMLLRLRFLLEKAYAQLQHDRLYLRRLRDLIHKGLYHRKSMQLAQYLAEHLGSLVGVEEVHFLLWDEATQDYCPIPPPQRTSPPPQKVEGLLPWAEAARQHRGPLLANPQTPPSTAPWPPPPAHLLAIPMFASGDQYLGTIVFLNAPDQPFSPLAVERAVDAVEVITLILLRSLAEDRLREELRLLSEVSHWAATLGQKQEEGEVVRKIGAGAQRLLEAQAAVVLLVDSRTWQFYPAFQQGISPAASQALAQHAGRPPFQRLLQGAPLVTVQNLAQSYPWLLGSMPAEITSMAGVALQGSQGLQGLLLLFWRTSHALPPEKRFVLRLIGSYGGSALHNARLIGFLQREVRTDPLTGLPNRRAFEEMLIHEVRRAQRYRHAFTLLVLDLDGFKAINDLYGHVKGDTVLRHTAQALRKSLRESDFLARYGGDEFIALLPETSLNQAQVVARKLHQAISDLTFPGLPPEVRCGLSVGMAVFPYDATDPQRLLELADQRMYADKARHHTPSA